MLSEIAETTFMTRSGHAGQKICCHAQSGPTSSQQRFARGKIAALCSTRFRRFEARRRHPPPTEGEGLKRHGIAITPLAPARLRAEVPISPPFLRGSRIRRRRFDPGADGLR